MREQEVQRRPASVAHHRLDDLVQGLAGDQSGERLVVVDRLAAGVANEARQEIGKRRADRGDNGNERQPLRFGSQARG